MDISIVDDNFTASSLKTISDEVSAYTDIQVLTDKYITITKEHAYFAARSGKYEASIIISELNLEANISIAQDTLKFLSDLGYHTILIEEYEIRIILFSWGCS